MGIIGVVAALTIPNLNQSTGDREKVAKVKKVYANLEDAFGRATAVYGPFDEWFINDGNDYSMKNKRFAERMMEFLKVSKDCVIGEGCFSEQPFIYSSGFKAADNYFSFLTGVTSYMIILSDGTSLAFQADGDTLTHPAIRFDIDGPNKGKNQAGNDIFDVFIIDGQLKSFGLEEDDGDLELSHGTNFTYWVLKNDNLDYLKCGIDLDWETKTSCK